MVHFFADMRSNDSGDSVYSDHDEEITSAALSMATMSAAVSMVGDDVSSHGFQCNAETRLTPQGCYGRVSCLFMTINDMPCS